jgi:hypothetical protein
MIKPTCALFTPKDLAKSGIVGAMMPKPTATKKDEKTRTPTSRGNSAKGFEGLKRAERFKVFTVCLSGVVREFQSWG